MYLNQNLTLLKMYKSRLHDQLLIRAIGISTEIELETTRTNETTAKVALLNRKIYLHSKYDPIKEAEKFAIENYSEEFDGFLVIGFGLGYHIKELQKKLKINQNIDIIESNIDILRTAFDANNLEELIIDKRINIYYENSIQGYTYRCKELLGKKNTKILIHNPSLQAFPDFLTDIKYLIEEYRMKEQTARSHSDLLEYNFHHNIKKFDYPVDSMFNQFKCLPIIVVSAGPSLDKNKHLLKQCKNKAIVIVVGRAAITVVQSGLVPDFIVITEPKPKSFYQIRSIKEAQDIPVIALSSADKEIFDSYPGLKLIAFQTGFQPAEEYALNNNRKINDTGGSVATTALDVALMFGGNPIVFMGQDLAYTEGRTHTEGTWHRKVEDLSNMREVQGYYGEKVYTTKNLNIYLRWFEDKILRNPNTTFINATEGGARIKGTIQMSLQDVIDKFIINNSIDIKSIVTKAIQKYNKEK
ncbi:hypothetical protein BHU72_00190 [Desulfuribacillus stibiiarsenatis]|uniref:DUF115 domain-containing protein n=1 Tax=Desulfuribacillus stibiiarsenatis TaxID=1390249 RepID=A0A1E5L9A0_9FIRM|nr:6-hydroxymethylpterin diphosphokinase MptE-like protein [Desulfuribacillus stibiiarsenatis]OEH86732.1 hypothetical protein BHU72_00190 [Desulfuribacillus stibiiarsenatis]